MFSSIQNIFKVPDLRRKILFTLAIFIVYRIGGHIPTPGIDSTALSVFFERARGTILGLYDIFVGGSLGRATIFALGIMPYISASIIFQLLTAVVPYLEKLHKEGEEGRRKITQYTRYATVFLASVQAFTVSKFLETLNPEGIPVVPNPGLRFELVTVITLTAGTIFVMWLGEQITEHGIGNGISLIIFVGCLDTIPRDVLNTLRMVVSGAMSWVAVIFVGALMIMIIASVVFITQGQRRIPVQYAKRVVGRRIYGGQSTHIPLNVNSAGVIPIIFAQSIIMFPSTLSQFFGKSDWAQTVAATIQPGGWLYTILYAGLIVFFAYFYTAIVINPTDLADNMKKYGGFIPGVRPGTRTAEYVDKVLTRITLPGALFFAFIAVLPYFLMRGLRVPFYFGGTTLIIIVGVALDTAQQIEAQLMMRHYEGFLRKGKLRGRRR